jgi:protein ImuB
MVQLACVDLPAFPLQLLLRRHPEWACYPAAVVAEDKPQGVVLWVNERARQLGVLPGQRYAAALSLATGLHAGEVKSTEIQKAIRELMHRLIRFTPEVEPAAEEPGVFWLNGMGLKLLFPSSERWARALHADITAEKFQVSVGAGFTRFGTYAVAKTKKGITVFDDLAEEQQAVQKVPLHRLDLDPDFRDTLFKLGIKTVGALLSLPPVGLRERFGPKAYRLHRMAAGDLWTPLDPSKPEEPIMKHRILDDPENDTTRLLFLIKQLLHPMLATLAARAQAVETLWISLLIDKADRLKEQIRPAMPTLDSIQILDLVRLRLESMQFFAGVTEIALEAEACAATAEQLCLFSEGAVLSPSAMLRINSVEGPVLSGVEGPKRDLDAANRALARLRAEFGDDAVVQAKLKDGHLPEARFAWEPLSRVKLPKNDLNRLNGLNVLNSPASKVLVRRILAKPIRLPGVPRYTHEDGWLILGHKYGSVDKLSGPYVFSGGWWNREIKRDYYFAETRRGAIAWVYYDRVRRRWFLQGWIE